MENLQTDIFNDPKVMSHINNMIGCVVAMREVLSRHIGHEEYPTIYAEYVEFCVKMGIETKHITEFLK